MDLRDGCLERALLAAEYVIDESSRKAVRGNLRRYLCENCGLWWKKVEQVGVDVSPLCKQCRNDRGYSKNNPKGYPKLY